MITLAEDLADDLPVDIVVREHGTPASCTVLDLRKLLRVEAELAVLDASLTGAALAGFRQRGDKIDFALGQARNGAQLVKIVRELLTNEAVVAVIPPRLLTRLNILCL